MLIMAERITDIKSLIYIEVFQISDATEEPLNALTTMGRTPWSDRKERYVWVIDQASCQNGWILARSFFACLWTGP